MNERIPRLREEVELTVIRADGAVEKQTVKDEPAALIQLAKEILQHGRRTN